MNKSTEIQTLIARSKAVHTVTGVGTIQLIKPDGDGVVLDSILVMRPPNNVRLRATKFSHVVFDLTTTPDGVYLQADKSSKAQTAGATAAQVTRAMSLLTGNFFADPKLVSRDDGNDLILSLAQSDGATLICRVDRRTLTAREFKIVDPSGRSHLRLSLAEYTTQGDAVWPRKATAVSDAGTVVVSLDDLTLNEPLADEALTPPPGAEKLP